MRRKHGKGPEEESPPLPKELPSELETLLYPTETVRLALETDVQADGQFGPEWLVATDRRVLVASPNHGVPQARLALRWLDIDEVKVEHFVGNGVLYLRTPQETLEALRFSRSRAHDFSAAAQALERLRENGGREDDTETDEAPHRPPLGKQPKGRCPRCGRVLPSWSQVCPSCLQKTKLVLRLLDYVRPFWPWAVGGFLLMLLITTIDLVPPYLSKIMVDDVIGQRNFGLLKVVVGLIIGVHASSALLGAGRGYLMAWLGQHVTLSVRLQVYEHLQLLSLRYYDEQQTGQIMSRITRDTGNLQDFLTEGLQDLVRDVLTCVLIGGVLFHLNPSLAALTLIPIPLLAVGSLVFGRRIRYVYRRTWRHWGALSAILADTIPGVRVVKAFAQERREVKKFTDCNHRLVRISLLSARLRTIFFPAMGLVTSVGSMIVWGIGGYWVMKGTGHSPDLTLGALVAFIAYLWRFYRPIQELSRLYDRLLRAATAAERVFEVLDTEPDVADAPEAYDLPEITGHIQFDDVTFSYDGMQDVLKNISFEVQPGEMIGLVGPSGAGKTTLINLLCRFYEVPTGAIRVDGHDLRNVTLHSLRRQIGMVLQEPFLFHGTIAENIAYGKPDATPEEIIAAARAANAHSFIIRFPDGYDTFVGERGVRLSGGEKQRLSIARAILKNPRILIFDEATSSVDTETEAEIRQAIDRLVQGRTTFAIAHRFSTLRHADRLIVLDRGNLVEMGTHEELMAREEGLFARLCRLQTELSQVVAWQE